MSDLRRWTGPLDPGPFSFREARRPSVRVRRPVVAKDGTYTGEVLTRDGPGPFRSEHDPQLAGARCPGATARADT